MASCGTLTVEEAPTFDPGAVQVSGCVDLPSSMEPGESATLRVSIVNQNALAGSGEIVVLADGIELGREPTFSLNAGEQDTRRVDVTAPSSTGDFTVTAEAVGWGGTTTALAAGPGISRGVLEALEGEIAGVDKRTVAAGGAGLGTALAVLALA